MAVNLSPVGGVAGQFFDNNGDPLSGGKIYTYAAGTTTPLATYTSSSGTIPHTNPIILDSAGRVPGGEIWLTNNVQYKFILKTSVEILIGTYDNVVGIISVAYDNANEISYLPPYTGAVASNVEKRLSQTPTPKDFGAVGNGTTDDTAALEAAITYANSQQTMLYFDGATYRISSILTLPAAGISGKAVITGATVRWKECKNPKLVGELVCDALIIDSVWYASFEKIYCTNAITLQSSNPAWGTFWNNFGNIYCGGTLTINVDQGQSVNGNIFQNVAAQGGLHIKGVNTTGITEAYNNIFVTLDTTFANLAATDSTVGWHILNDSVRNQTNTVMNWNAEVTGNRGVKGNWNILASNVDANNTPVANTDRNHYLFSGTTIQRNDGDFFASSAPNLAVGGEWDVLNSTMVRPYCLSEFGFVSLATPYGATTCPSQINREWAIETSAANSGFALNFNFSSPQTVILAMWYRGDDFEVIFNGAGTFYTTGLYYTHSSGWKLLRVVVKDVTTSIIFALNGASAAYKKCSVNSVFATNSKTCLLPGKKDGNVRVRGNLTVAGGSSVDIPLPTSGTLDYVQGLCKVSAVATPIAPSFAGIAGSIDVEFAKTRYGGVDNATVLGTVNRAIGQLNTTGKTITVTGNTAGINLALSAGTDPCAIQYELEIYQKYA